jgi:osmotically inducible protein OsmC
MKRKASAVWKGDLKDGRGLVSTESQTLSNASYGFSSRFERGSGTNPEELIAAAHAACFSMALAAELGKASLNPEQIDTQATITLDKLDAGWRVTAIRLDVRAKVPDADPDQFQKAAETVKTGCPISALLNAPITLTAELV